MIVFVNVFAAFCATEITFEKKPPPPGVGGTVGFSGVGVNGASVLLDSLLGPILDPDPDRARRCEIMLLGGTTTVFGMELPKTSELRLAEPLCSLGDDESVGVGGVLTITGRADSEGGVRGGMEISTLV